MSTRLETGTCFCGAVAAEMRGDPFWICYDHDDGCRRAIGSPLTIWIGYHPSEFRLTRGVLIPTALIADRSGPLAAGGRGQAAGRRRPPGPGLAAGRADRLGVRPAATAEFVLPQVLPHVLDRVQTLWGGRRG